jgi:cellulose synthase/poly-beta-1,6-N-acetylglucosamine synthase-like glycosyltransferase
MELWLKGLLWLTVAMVALVTVGYPLLLAIAGALVRRHWQVEDAEPSVSLIIAAFNEERCIAQKLENALALDYPREHLEIIVASDGSTDRTAEIVESFRDRGVVLRAFPRMGKTGIQNQAVKTATGDILVFSDANGFYRPDAVRKLVRNFADPTVACVSGQLVYTADRQTAGDCERSYWHYEKFMKRRESRLSSLVGANGSIYAVRRADYVEIDHDLISDLVEPLALVLRGRRVVYEPEAVSVEEASTVYSVEFRRKVRILTRSIRGLVHMRALLNPIRYGVFSFQLLLHKVLRYLVPYFLITGFASLGALAGLGHYRIPFVVASSAMAVAIVVGRARRTRPSNLIVRACHFLYYYLLVNYALVPAWINIVRGAHMTVWVPERESA